MAEATATRGASRMIIIAVFTVLITVALAYAIATGGIDAAGAFAVIPVAILFAAVCIGKPKTGMLIYLHTSFFVVGLNRFLPPSIPYGLATDGILALCFLGTIFQAKKEDWKRANNPITWVVVGWFVYCCFELVNPEARSREAWFFAVRGVALYWVMAIPLLFIWMHKREDLEKFIKIWLGWSLVAAIWGFKQQYIGLTAGEVRWLDEGGRITHVLMGKLRSFSFYSDAGQFGAAMAHATLFSIIMALGQKDWKGKFTYGGLAMVYFWGFALSGSRGPLFVIAGGFFMYLFMVKNFKILVIGLVAGAITFSTLKYTYLGQGNYQIQRLRSALDPQDASFQVRLENQRKLRTYLSSRPLGGGIGAGGTWGQRFSPGTFLAETALDSWYVKIWVETGIIGLWLHIIQILVIIFYGFKKVFYLRDDDLRTKCIGLLCSFTGIALASYGNQILGQLPTGTIIYFSMVFFYLCDKWDTAPKKEEEKKELKPELKPGLLW